MLPTSRHYPIYVLWRAQITKHFVTILVLASCHMKRKLSSSLSNEHVVYNIYILVVRGIVVAVLN
jgi:hypothetical protein